MLVSSVPGEIRQWYAITDGDRVERQVEVTSTGVDVSTDPVAASVDQIAATVRGVICVPRPAVLLDTTEGRVQAYTTDEWMNAAWQLKDRDDLVATVVSNSSGTRLIAIRTAADQAERVRVPSAEETLERFDGVLRILAR